MSWDVILFKVPPNVVSLEEAGVTLTPLGTKLEVISKLKRIIPNVDFSDPTWGKLDGDNYFIEFSMGKEEIIDGLMLHIRGGNEVIEVLKTISKDTGWKPFDCSNGELIDFDYYPEGLQKWKDFREQMAQKLKIKSPIKGITLNPEEDKGGIGVW